MTFASRQEVFFFTQTQGVNPCIEELKRVHRKEKEISKNFKTFKHKTEFEHSTKKAAKPSPKFSEFL